VPRECTDGSNPYGSLLPRVSLVAHGCSRGLAVIPVHSFILSFISWTAGLFPFVLFAYFTLFISSAQLVTSDSSPRSRKLAELPLTFCTLLYSLTLSRFRSSSLWSLVISLGPCTVSLFSPPSFPPLTCQGYIHSHSFCGIYRKPNSRPLDHAIVAYSLRLHFPPFTWIPPSPIGHGWPSQGLRRLARPKPCPPSRPLPRTCRAPVPRRNPQELP
jgi:hypothetical protein